MRPRLIPVTGCGWFACVLALLACGQVSGQAGEMRLRGFLLWGTDQSQPPADRPYGPADPEIRQKLKALPLKWTNWFEVNRKEFVVPHLGIKEVPMSAKCQLNVRKGAGAEIEISLIGKGKEVVRQKQALPKGEMLVLGGNAPNSTCWLVVLKRIE